MAYLTNPDSSISAFHNILLSLAFFLSGFCGLIYEVIWIRKFTLIFGSTLSAMSAVIAIFFFGLAAGSWIFGKVSVYSKNPVRLYALFEVIISIYAMMLPLSLRVIENVYGWLYPLVFGSFALLLSIRLLLAFVVLLLPTLLMGGTLPVLTKHFVKELACAGRQVGMLYGLNALGAALGCFFAGYLLLRTLGAHRTNMLISLINLMVGLSALLISRRTNTVTVPEVSVNDRENAEKIRSEKEYPGRIMLSIGCFAISGFVSMAYEIIWLRYLLFFFRDTIYLYSGIITVFISGIGAGSLSYKWLLNRVKATMASFGCLHLGIGMFTIIAIYLPIPWHQNIFDAAEKSRGNLLVLLFILLITPTLLMGATFPIVTKIITKDLKTVGYRIGKAYALNTVGSILGSMAAGFLFLPFLGLQTTLYILFGMNMILATVLIMTEVHVQKYFGLIPLSLCILFPVSIEYGLGFHLPDILVKKIIKHEQILEIGEGITGTTWATKSRFGTKLFENRVVISRSGPGSFSMEGFIPLLLAPTIPRNILGLCFGGGVSSHVGILFPEVEHFDFVDISKKNVEIALRHFDHNHGLREDRRVTFVIDDAHNFVKYIKNKYDLVLMDPNPPALSFRCAALYTKEFYQLVKERLSGGGYFSQVLPLDHMSETETMSVVKTFSSVFENCLLWWNGVDPVMIGSNRHFQLDLREIGRRLDQPLIQRYAKEYSAGARYHLLGYLLSGFLLTTEGFKRVAVGGTVLTNDLTTLEFSTGQEISPASVVRIHRNLSPWTELRRVLVGFEEADKYIRRIEEQREYLMRTLFYTLQSKRH